MRDRKKPWFDVPIEVLIEEERRKRLEKQEAERPRVNISPPLLTPPTDEEQTEKENDYLIDFSLR